MNFPIRYIARIVLEAETPLSIGSDNVLFDQDSPVQKDWNGLPIIPGTAITGFLRAKLQSYPKIGVLFGDLADKIRIENDVSNGSKLTISDGYLLGSDSKVHQHCTVFETNPTKVNDIFLSNAN